MRSRTGLLALLALLGLLLTSVPAAAQTAPTTPDRYGTAAQVAFDAFPAALGLIEGRADVLVSTLSFALGELNAGGVTAAGANVAALERLGIPIGTFMSRLGRGRAALRSMLNQARRPKLRLVGRSE